MHYREGTMSPLPDGRRHGPLVLGVCRRVLRNTHDAEDAFQATFLVLARQAGSIRSRQVVASWLYGVAYRTAMKARVMSAKRRAKERQAAEKSRPGGEACEELLAQLDYELNHLPDKYRVPVILYELEGRSRKEVARLLGVPEGTLSWRLAQAKKLLARRLSRYGAVAVATLLTESAASACLSTALRASTVKAALTAGTVPAEVLTLAEGIVKDMLLSKLKITVCAGVLMLTGGIGVSGLTYRATAQQPAQGAARASRSQSDELESRRLEIDALRKELRATKARVKVLEEEQKRRSETDRLRLQQLAVQRDIESAVREWEKADNPLAHAEEALKKLRANPEDKKATEELERALKRLKEREKPKQSGPVDPLRKR